MTMQVAHASPHKARRKPAHPPVAPAWSPVKLAGPALSGAVVLPATAGTPAPAAPPGAPVATPAPAAPAAAVKSPEYADPLDPGAIVGDISGGVTGDMVGPHVANGVGLLLNDKNIPWLGSKYGSVVPGKVAGVLTGELSNIAGQLVTGGMHALLKHKDGEGKPDGGLHVEFTPPNKLIARTVKGISTTWIKTLVAQALNPAPAPAPAPTPVQAAIAPAAADPSAPPVPAPGDTAPGDTPPPPPTPIPAAGPRLVLVKGAKHLVIDPGHPATDTSNPPPPALPGASIDIVKPSLPKLSPLVQAGANGLIGVAISAVYDQAVGPLVQRAANFITGKGGDPVAPPKPLTPGGVASGFVDGVLGGLLVRTVGDISFGGKPTPMGISLGSSIVNGVIGAAWNTVYSRGLGPAIEKGVNQAAGIRSKEDQEKDVLGAGEQFSRAATRGVAAGAATFLVGKALWAPIMQLGMSVGGVGGLFIAVAGSSLIGAVSGGLVDATIGPMLGKLGGGIYSWITGKPSYEARMKDAASKPGPTPGSPVDAKNGNPGTVPAPGAAAPAPAPATPAPAAPAAGAPKKRKLTGNKAVDATSPSAKLGAAKLAKIAAKAG